MLSNLLLLCFIGHISGDFYLSKDPVNGKINKFSKLLVHTGVYIIPFIILFLLFGRSYGLFMVFLWICTAHFLIDLVGFFISKSRFTKKLNSKSNQCGLANYAIDEFLHILFTLLIGIYFSNPTFNIISVPFINDFLKVVNLDLTRALKWVLLVLCIYKPVNITFVKAFSHYKPLEKEESVDVKKAGAVIGFLERFLIIIFINIQQYSAIGLILTAKSIARYDSISKSQDFAEYYLIGTLSSLLSAILLYIIIFRHL
ncbi:MAG TPA: hypothetical protein DDZ89_16560 [Clostridiales bacterium]|nr:hypothetical protein [Clostridiales bacterium]